MLDIGGINWLPVIAVVVVNQVLGFLWYGPLFGSRWMEGLGKTEDELGSPVLAIPFGLVGSIVAATALALLLTAASDLDAIVGLTYGLVGGVGFAATAAVTGAMFENSNRTVVTIALGYQLLSFAIAGVLIGGWTTWGLPSLGG